MENEVLALIHPEALILIPVLYLIGLFLRQTPKIPIWMHAWIKLAVGITACMIYFGSSIVSFVQGVLVSGAAVLMKDLIHKTAEGTQTKDEDRQL